VHFRGPEADPKLVRDQLVGQASSQALKHFHFALRQAFDE